MEGDAVEPDLFQTRFEKATVSSRTNNGTKFRCGHFLHAGSTGGMTMKKYLYTAAVIGALATPAFADEVGVRIGPVGAGVTTGESHEYRDRDRDRDRDRTTVIKEREPSERTTVIKKEDEFGNRSKTVIHHDNE
jgi:hypothetical protein